MFNSKYATAAPDGRFLEIPKLMVAFDTETTGLWKPPTKCTDVGCTNPDHIKAGGYPSRMCTATRGLVRTNDTVFSGGKGIARDFSIHEPVTYGFAVFRNGKYCPEEGQRFVANPGSQLGNRALEIMTADPQKIASSVHGWDEHSLKSSYDGKTVGMVQHGVRPKNTLTGQAIVPYDPALDRETAARRAVETLADYQRQGAVINGANVLGFDLAMLANRYQTMTGLTMEESGFDLDKAVREGKIFDVIKHHQTMTGETFRRPLSLPNVWARRFDRNLLSDLPKATLSQLYNVDQGNHSAEEDARASGQVGIRQILTNQGKFTPFETGPHLR